MTFSTGITATCVRGHDVHKRPLPSLVTIVIVPVSAAAKLTPLMPISARRNAGRRWSCAHDHLRPAFLRAEMGISGVNFAAADTGTITIVTNEGNGRLCTSWPRTHVAVMPVEKVIPRLVDLATLLPLLTRSATGQAMSNYLSM